MKLLIGGSKSKFFHLKEFGDALTKYGIEYKLVHDEDVYDGFPSRNFKNWIQTRSKFNKTISDFKPDAIFVDRQRHFALAATQSKIPSFMLLRGNFWLEMKWARETLYRSPFRRLALWRWKNIGDKCFSNSSVILPICSYLENIVKEHYPNKPTVVLHGGIDPTRWYPVPEMNLKHPCVGLLQGAWIWGKAKEMLTLDKVLDAMPDVTFYWAGDGPYRNEVLAKLGKHQNFKWLGSLQYPDKVREYLATIDIYALTSGIDMSPLTLQEAQLMQKPVIATRVGGIPELMIDNKTGFLIDEGDHKMLIEKLSILLNDPRKAKEMGINGREFVINNFSWDIIAKRFVEVMKKFLS